MTYFDTPLAERIENAVAKGADLLDKHFGPSWVERINRDTLDVSSTFDCILGQLWSDHPDSSDYTTPWGLGMVELFGDRDSGMASEYGFDNTGILDESSYTEIQVEWDNLLDSRL